MPRPRSRGSAHLPPPPARRGSRPPRGSSRDVPAFPFAPPRLPRVFSCGPARRIPRRRASRCPAPAISRAVCGLRGPWARGTCGPQSPPDPSASVDLELPSQTFAPSPPPLVVGLRKTCAADAEPMGPFWLYLRRSRALRARHERRSRQLAQIARLTPRHGRGALVSDVRRPPIRPVVHFSPPPPPPEVPLPTPLLFPLLGLGALVGRRQQFAWKRRPQQMCCARGVSVARVAVWEGRAVRMFSA